MDRGNCMIDGGWWVLALVYGLLLGMCESGCNFPAIFNFGDSSSDTGALHFAFPYHMLAENPPYGRTFFGRPVNRYSDGRLSIDFFASAMGYPFLSPYVQSVGSNYAHGVNFAASGATVRDISHDPSYFAPINLVIQVNQLKIFKQQVLATIATHGNLGYLPTTEAFSKGIYILDIGGNDFRYAYLNLQMSPEQIQKSILPEVAKNVANAVKELYNEGARTFLVRDVGPQGCQTFWLAYFPHSAADLDKNGCSISYNTAVSHYNNLLRAQLAFLRRQLQGASIIYVNTFGILYDLVANAAEYGFKQTTIACCGVGGKYNFSWGVACGFSGTLDGKTVKADSCADPSTYMNWDGVHWTDQANRLLTTKILSGKYFEPSFSIASQCNLSPI